MYAAVVVIMTLLKLVFILYNIDVYAFYGIGSWLSAMAHGFSMDLAVGGYFMALPGLLLAASPFIPVRIVDKSLKIYWYVIMSIVSVITLSDTVLYSFWGFKIDATPIFYLTSSPALAFASVEWWLVIVGLAAMALLAWGTGWLMRWICRKTPLNDMVAVRQSETPKKHRIRQIKAAGVATLLAALLFIPIRGGFTVSTMNPGYAYFSTQAPLNHAAVNPEFSLLYSLSHQNDFASAYRYFNNDDQAYALAAPLLPAAPEHIPANDSIPALATMRPDIYIVILESFSNQLFPSLGGKDIAVCLDSVANSGNSLLFTNFYANSFRTDRAIPSILSAAPALPSVSLMKQMDIAESLPNIAATLADNGYTTHYYYGGDINFTNQLAYIKSGGFNHIVSDKDFPMSQRMSKWGVNDGPLFDKVADDLFGKEAARALEPRFVVIQTSSSHEPFNVPDFQRHPEPAANAFAYADSCAGAWLNKLQASPSPRRKLVIFVPDHYGAWPKNLEFADRHRVPLIITGDALMQHGRIEKVSSQKDIAATLMGMLNLPSTQFPMSRDILSAANHGAAFFCEPDIAAYVSPDGAIATLSINTPDDGSPIAKAFLQTLSAYLTSISSPFN